MISIKNILIYYLIGIIVSIYMIYFYRYSKNKTKEKSSDLILCIIGPIIWPIQIIKHLLDLMTK